MSSPEGFGMIPSWLLYDRRVSSPAKLVYVLLSTYVGGEGPASEEVLMAQSGLKSRAFGEAISDLIRLGVLQGYLAHRPVSFALAVHLPEDDDV